MADKEDEVTEEIARFLLELLGFRAGKRKGKPKGRKAKAARARKGTEGALAKYEDLEIAITNALRRKAKKGERVRDRLAKYGILEMASIAKFGRKGRERKKVEAFAEKLGGYGRLEMAKIEKLKKEKGGGEGTIADKVARLGIGEAGKGEEKRKAVAGKVAEGKAAAGSIVAVAAPEGETEKAVAVKIEPAVILPPNIQNVYRNSMREEHEIADQIADVEEQIRNLDNEFYARKIAIEDYKKRKVDYEEKLFMLKQRKKRLAERENSVNEYKGVVKEDLTADEEMKGIEALLREIEDKYYRKEITEDEFRQKKAEHEEKLFMLRQKKKAISSRKTEIEKTITRPIIVQKPEGISAKEVELPKFISEHEKSGYGLVMPELGRKAEEEGEREKISAAGKMEAKTSLDMFIEAKAAGKIDEGRLNKVESDLKEIMKQYNIPEDEIRKELENVKTEDIIRASNNFIDLVKLEHRAAAIRQQPEIRAAEAKPLKYEVKAIMREIIKHRIVTDFDKVLFFVKEKGIIRAGVVQKALGIDDARFEDVVSILEGGNLIRVEYPPVGGMFLVDIAYEKPKKPASFGGRGLFGLSFRKREKNESEAQKGEERKGEKFKFKLPFKFGKR